MNKKEPNMFLEPSNTKAKNLKIFLKKKKKLLKNQLMVLNILYSKIKMF